MRNNKIFISNSKFNSKMSQLRWTLRKILSTWYLNSFKYLPRTLSLHLNMYYYSRVCVCVWMGVGAHATTGVVKRTIFFFFWGWFSPSIFVWVQGIELTRLSTKCHNPLGHVKGLGPHYAALVGLQLTVDQVSHEFIEMYLPDPWR